MKLGLLPKLVEKLVWVQVISFCKISFPVTHLMMAYYDETDGSRTPNRLTLRITLLYTKDLKMMIIFENRLSEDFENRWVNEHIPRLTTLNIP
jgi:hypothetical protein